MVLKNIENTDERFEWYRYGGNDMGDIPEGVDEKAFYDVFRRLVTCNIYGKVLGAMENRRPYSGNSIYAMAKKGKRRKKSEDGKTFEYVKVNKFVIGGVVFILMSNSEYYAYLKMYAPIRQKKNDATRRKQLMAQPKTRDESDRFRDDREAAERDWREGRLRGDEWNRFFTEIFPFYEDKFAADSIAEWLSGCGYHACSDIKNGIVKKQRHRSGNLWKEYKEWCRDNGYVPKYVKEFSLRLVDEGFKKRYGGGRFFDVFVSEKDGLDGDDKAEREERAEKEMERLMKERGTRLELTEDYDTVWLVGVSPGRYVAAELYRQYEMWAMERNQEIKGTRTFYKWLVDEGFSRETKGGTLWLEK